MLSTPGTTVEHYTSAQMQKLKKSGDEVVPNELYFVRKYSLRVA